MFWQEDNDTEITLPENRSVDLVFSINCPMLPADHAESLSNAIASILPWFGDDELSGLHLIHGADSGNGWERPDDLLHLSRRTKLCIRVANEKVEEAKALCNQKLEVADYPLQVIQFKTRPLAKTNFLYSRYVAHPIEWDEDQFMDWAVSELKRNRLKFKKMLCGKQHQLVTENGLINTRSLMIAELPFEDAYFLQEEGLGPHRTLGCGIFIPQKSF